MSTFTPMRDKIIATDIERGPSLTRGGIILPDDDGRDNGIKPRWCKVYAIGSDIDYLEVGEWILVKHGRWSRGAAIKEEDGSEVIIRMIEPDSILLVADEPPCEAAPARL